MLISIIVDLKNIESYLKNQQIELAISELKNLKTEQDFTKAYYLFLKYNLDESQIFNNLSECTQRALQLVKKNKKNSKVIQ